MVFSGKAHPQDETGKSIVQNLVKIDRRYKDRVVFLEDYDLEIAKYMVTGCDVWLNNPRRPLEASGTSGMKAAMNGVLNLSILDGWVSEGVEHSKSGWIIDDIFDETFQNLDEDKKDLQGLHKVLTELILPLYYSDKDTWIEMMRNSIEMSQYKFSSERMLNEYYEKIYTHSITKSKLESIEC